MRVLSLFDGMSCGQLALQRAGIKVSEYYASEVDKYAIQVAKKNFPGTIHIGSVVDVKADTLPQIDLLIGGSPCQGFSFAGKQLNFDDERSKLFFEYVRLLKECKPRYFLLGNVKMKKEYQDVISDLLGVQPIVINSALVSAQNRTRLYWTNIPNVLVPKDKGVIIENILQPELDVNQKYILTGKWVEWMKRNGSERIYKSHIRLGGLKAICLTARTYANWNGNFVLISKKGVPKISQEKSGCLTAGAHSAGNHSDMDLLLNENLIRRYTPVECERLQTMPDNYTAGVSDSQRYKMLGNGWTVDVIAHILKHIL